MKFISYKNEICRLSDLKFVKRKDKFISIFFEKTEWHICFFPNNILIVIEDFIRGINSYKIYNGEDESILDLDYAIIIMEKENEKS